MPTINNTYGRTATAEMIASSAIVFVRKARSEGYANKLTRLLIDEIAQELGISSSRWTFSTVVKIAERNAALMDETHLLDLSPSPAAAAPPPDPAAETPAAPSSTPTAPRPTNKRRTKYQMTHAPVRTLENKCTSTDLDARGLCTACGRLLSRRIAHNPNRTGSLGWTAHYGDGSTRFIAPSSS